MGPKVQKGEKDGIQPIWPVLHNECVVITSRALAQETITWQPGKRFWLYQELWKEKNWGYLETLSCSHKLPD